MPAISHLTTRCDICKYQSKRCELAYSINFCDDCKYSLDCTIKSVWCDAGYDVECNNGFEPNDEYCEEDEDVLS